MKKYISILSVTIMTIALAYCGCDDSSSKHEEDCNGVIMPEGSVNCQCIEGTWQNCTAFW